MLGLCGAAVVFWIMAQVLWSPNENMQSADYHMVGVLGRLSQPIREGGIGELIYSHGGARKSCGARSADGRAIEKGAEVVVTGYERGHRRTVRATGTRSAADEPVGRVGEPFRHGGGTMGLQTMSVGFWVVVGLMVLAVALLGSFLASLYRKAGPHEALIVYGFRGTRIVKGHGTVIFPMVESSPRAVAGADVVRRRARSRTSTPSRAWRSRSKRSRRSR